MSFVTENQPDGTPTWIDLGVPDLERAMAFYGAVFGWEFEVGTPETMRYTQCLLGGRRVAGLAENPDPAATAFWWTVYLATADCDAAARRVTGAGGTIVMDPMQVMEQGRMAIAKDPVGAQFGLWQGGAHIGCEVVNEPGSLLRNDLVTSDPEPARAFYAAVFDFTLDGTPGTPMIPPISWPSGWTTLFEVADTDTAVARAAEAGGVAGTPEDFVYGRIATVTDPFGAEFSVGSRPRAQGG